MKKNMYSRTVLFILFLCNSVILSAQKTDVFKDLPIVATKKGNLVVADLSQIKKTVSMPLSAFTEELQILKLDDSDEALVPQSGIVVSDNYILIKGENSIPFKLFNKKDGKFIANVGSHGQGPGEYQLIYDMQLDEKNNRIYLLPWHAKNILSYDLKGNFIEAIPLCFEAPKGKFHVDTKANKATVVTLPFTGIKAVVWTQDLKGNLIHSVAPGHLAITPDFSNEVNGGKSGSDFSFNIFTFSPRLDSLYRYKNEKIIPAFTLDFKGKDPSIHGYRETPKYFLGDLSDPKKINEFLTTTQNNAFYIIDKESLKGSFFELKNDFLGDLNIGWPIYSFWGDYFCQNLDPGNLKTQLEEALKNTKLSNEMRAKLKKLAGSITDNDNNYILYAKWK
jgi:hypothetical protein